MSKKLKQAFVCTFSCIALLNVPVSSEAEESSQVKSFNKNNWKQYSNRIAMAQYLIKSKRLNNMHKADVHALLGLPFWDGETQDLYPLELVSSSFHRPTPVVPALKVEYVRGSTKLVSLSVCTIPANLAFPENSKSNE